MLNNIEINEIDNLDEYSLAFRDKGRIQIHNFFQENTANHLYEMLQTNSDWYLAYNEGESYYESSMVEINRLIPRERDKFMSNIYRRAQYDFQYLFKQYYITQAVDLGEQLGHPMHKLNEFINSELMINFIKKLTGETSIVKADIYASSFGAGHFLTKHDDKHNKHKRLVAFVFSMTKKWSPNWGGHLAFFDNVGNIEEAFIPSFNTLNIFQVPQEHSVQMIAPFAKEKRISFLGWFQC